MRLEPPQKYYDQGFYMHVLYRLFWYMFSPYLMYNRYTVSGQSCTLDDCDYVVTYAVHNELARFEISAKAEWAAIGFSSDRLMVRVIFSRQVSLTRQAFLVTFLHGSRSKTRKRLRPKVYIWEVVLDAPDRVNIPCLMHDTRLCQLDVKMTRLGM